MAKNMLALLPDLIVQERNDIVSALKCFREMYETLDAAKLALVNRDHVIVAVRLWGPAPLAEKLEEWQERNQS